MRIVNCTQHELVIWKGEEVVEKIPPSGMEIRAKETRTPAGFTVNGIPVNSVALGEPTGVLEVFPANTVYVVSRAAAESIKLHKPETYRKVLFVIPDETVRDSEGKIVGCRAFAVI